MKNDAKFNPDNLIFSINGVYYCTTDIEESVLTIRNDINVNIDHVMLINVSDHPYNLTGKERIFKLDDSLVESNKNLRHHYLVSLFGQFNDLHYRGKETTDSLIRQLFSLRHDRLQKISIYVNGIGFYKSPIVHAQIASSFGDIEKNLVLTPNSLEEIESFKRLVELIRSEKENNFSISLPSYSYIR